LATNNQTASQNLYGLLGLDSDQSRDQFERRGAAVPLRRGGQAGAGAQRQRRRDGDLQLRREQPAVDERRRGGHYLLRLGRRAGDRRIRAVRGERVIVADRVRLSRRATAGDNERSGRQRDEVPSPRPAGNKRGDRSVERRVGDEADGDAVRDAAADGRIRRRQLVAAPVEGQPVEEAVHQL